jgi:tetratricopeptide (TPR) repeat protein
MIAGMYDEAMADFAVAESICKEDNRDLLFSVYTNRACIYYGRGDVTSAEVETEKAMACAGRPKFLVLMNKASGLITTGDFHGALAIVESVLNDNKELQAEWLDIAARSLMGWALIECGRCHEAFQCEVMVKSQLSIDRVHTNDWSYTAVFLAKAALLRGEKGNARRILQEALATDIYKTVFGEIRMDIAMAEILLDEEVDLSYHYARSAALLAERAKSPVMLERAALILDSIRARA